MICPTCNGRGYVILPFSKIGSILCHDCFGSNKVPDEVEEWKKQGEILKSRRIEKRITLRKASKFLKIDVDKLSRMERGFLKPDLNIQYYTIKVIKT